MKLAVPNAERIFHLAQAFIYDHRRGLTRLDRPPFLYNTKQIVDETATPRFTADLRKAKRRGFQIARYALLAHA
jgi:hypothetical protein